MGYVQYDEPKLKIMGIEAVKSSTPKACREKIKEALKVIMTKDESALIEFIDEFKKEFIELPNTKLYSIIMVFN